METTEVFVESTTEVISSNDPTMFNWFINCFYYEGDMLKTFLAVLGFAFILLFIFEAFYVLKQGSINTR